MTNRTAAQLPALLAFARPADDLEAAASFDAELEEARRAASLLGQDNHWLTCATLVAAVQVALDEERECWQLLSAAEDIVLDLRVEWGCEDWETTPDWSRPEVSDLATLDATCRALRQRARQQRETRLAKAAFTARRLARRAG